MIPTIFSTRTHRHRLSALALTAFIGFQVAGFSPAWSDHHINWMALNLDNSQSQEINRLESEWRNTYARLHPQVQRDRSTLRKLVNSPNANEGQVMLIQSRLQKNEERLRHEAMRIFMKKKQALTQTQKQQLRQMMTNH